MQSAVLARCCLKPKKPNLAAMVLLPLPGFSPLSDFTTTSQIHALVASAGVPIASVSSCAAVGAGDDVACTGAVLELRKAMASTRLPSSAIYFVLPALKAAGSGRYGDAPAAACASVISQIVADLPDPLQGKRDDCVDHLMGVAALSLRSCDATPSLLHDAVISLATRVSTGALVNVAVVLRAAMVWRRGDY